MTYDEDEFTDWKPDLSISKMFRISEFKEKLFYVDLLLTENSGQKVLDNSINYPDSPQEWMLDNKPIMLSDGYSSITMDEFTHRIFLHKDSSQVCSYNFRKVQSLRDTITKDLKEAKNG